MMELVTRACIHTQHVDNVSRQKSISLFHLNIYINIRIQIYYYCVNNTLDIGVNNIHNI